MSEIISMSCPSCGGDLQITEDIDQFVCAHCGKEHIVKRFGNTISLSPVVDQLKKVQVGIDKTASELAIERLHREIGELEQEYAAVWDERAKLKGIFSFLNRREIDQLTLQLDQIMKVAREKQAELIKHQEIVDF
jgi:reverse gyrase